MRVGGGNYERGLANIAIAKSKGHLIEEGGMLFDRRQVISKADIHEDGTKASKNEPVALRDWAEVTGQLQVPMWAQFAHGKRELSLPAGHNISATQPASPEAQARLQGAYDSCLALISGVREQCRETTVGFIENPDFKTESMTTAINKAMASAANLEKTQLEKLSTLLVQENHTTTDDMIMDCMERCAVPFKTVLSHQREIAGLEEAYRKGKKEDEKRKKDNELQRQRDKAANRK